MIKTDRLALVPWHDEHRVPFATMHADPIVMFDLGGPISRAESDAKLDRYAAAYVERGISRWAIEDAHGGFLGYAGVMPRLAPNHPLGPHFEIGWRLVRRAWGQGYATESARAALQDAFQRINLTEIVSYTGIDNRRSQAVMMRLGLRRDPLRDFTIDSARLGAWRGLVWVAQQPDPPDT